MTRPPAPITSRALNRATLARQFLLQRHRLSPLQALRRLVGLQGQAANPPYLALLARLDGFTLPQLTRLLDRGTVVRMASLRSTLHLIPADEALGLRALVQPMMQRALRSSRGRLLDGVDLGALATEAHHLLLSRPLTHSELGAALQRSWPGRDADAMATAARNLLPLAHLPPAGCWDCHARPQLEVLEARASDRTTTLDALVIRYLQAFGPARPKDMTTWCGIRHLAARFERLRPRLVTFADEHGREHFDLPRAPRPDANTLAPPRLLGPWEALLLSYEERSRFLRDEDRRAVFTSNGIVRATVWADGMVAGVWDLEEAGNSARIVLRPFQAFSSTIEAGLVQESTRVLQAVHPGRRHAVTFELVSAGTTRTGPHRLTSLST